LNLISSEAVMPSF